MMATMPRISPGVLLLAVACAAISACKTSINPVTGRRQVVLMTEADERQIDAAIVPQIEGREGLVRDLETAQQPLESLLGESRSTLQAAEGTSAELKALVVAVGTFLDRFETPEGAEPPPEPETPARPFDITEYGDTAARLGEAAAELRELVATLDASLPQVEQMVDAAATRGMGVRNPMRRANWLTVSMPTCCASLTVTTLTERFNASRSVIGPWNRLS